MMHRKLYLLLAVVFCWSGFLAAQDTLYVEGRPMSDGNIILWHPLDGQLWAQLLDVGYKVERYKLSGDGSIIPGSNEVVAGKRSPVLPRDQAWFNQHAQDEEGIMEAVGSLLYDSTFQFEATSELDADDLRFNLVVSEVIDRPEVAMALGMMHVDTTIQTGETYRYVITSADGQTAVGQVDVGDEGLATNMPGFFMSFEYPDGRSLTDMSGANQNIRIPQVIGIARPFGDSIVLRWAPNSSRLWMDANRDGYRIERTVIGSNDPPEEIAHVTTYPEDRITIQMADDDIAMIAVSNLYNTTATSGGGIFDKAAELENRWTFSLFAAERSNLAADILGLRFVDHQVTPGTEYAYTISTASQPDYFTSAHIRINNVYVQPPTPVGFTADPGDHVINLTWDKNGNASKFTAYNLERSANKGRDWQPLTDNLIVFVEDPDFPLPVYSFRDSVAENGKEFRYRLQGLTSFGDMSQFAEVRSEAIDLTPPPVPEILEARYNDTLGLAIIRWDPGTLPKDFRGFHVIMSDQPQGGQIDTVSTRLKRKKREYIFRKNDGFSGEDSHYFRVISADKNGNSSISMERYMHVPDLSAPPPPDSLVGNIADNGAVNLVWTHSEAKDVIGYWVYFANDTTEEFRLLNDDPQLSNSFSYKVNDVSLNTVAYYMVSAEDKSNNRGEPSRILKLLRPDKVPPVKPDFFNPTPTSGRIQVKWKESPSDDVSKYHVYRRIYGTGEEYVKIGEINSLDKEDFADSTVVIDVMYEYMIQAEDESGNVSEETLNFTSRLPFESEKIGIDNFKAMPGKSPNTAELTWSFTPPLKDIPEGVSWEFAILKSAGTSNVEFFQTVDANTFTFTDSTLTEGVLYNYAVQLRFSNDRPGKLSPVKSVMVGPGSVRPPDPVDKKKRKRK